MVDDSLRVQQSAAARLRLRTALPPQLLGFARQLRRHSTDPEQRMWSLLRDRRFLGHKFRRQTAISPYVIDFYCHALRLAVELDGGQHNDPDDRTRDDARTQFLARRGITVLRFWNNDFLARPGVVLEALWRAVEERSKTRD